MRKPSLKTLRKKADKVFSEFVRRRDKGICCTCCQVSNWKDGDCGHWINRTFLGTRFDERNAHFQDKNCNRFKNPMDEYAEFMLTKYGRKIMNELRKQKHWTLIEFVCCFIKWVSTQREAYESVIEHYSRKLEKMK